MSEVKVKNILALTYWSYKDALVQTYTLPYVRMIMRHLPQGSQIYLVTLEQAHLKMDDEESNRIKQALASEGIHLVLLGYTKFGIKAAARWQVFLVRLLALCRLKRITHIHAWCTPAGGAGYVLSKLTGRPLILDSFEPHAEAMVEAGHWGPRSLPFKILWRLERLQARRASAVIGTTQGVRNYAREKYGVELRNFYVKPAGVDLNLFCAASVKNPELLLHYGLSDKIVCAYAGKIGGTYLTREIFDFFKAASNYWGDKFRVLMLTNANAEQIRELALGSNLNPDLITAKFVPHEEVPKYIGLGDFAINPVRPVPTKRYCTSIKDGEYWAMGLPVVIPPHISDDSDIISANKIGSILRDFTAQAYTDSVREIDRLLKDHSRQELFEKIRAVAVEHRSYASADRIYNDIYGSAGAG